MDYLRITARSPTALRAVDIQLPHGLPPVSWRGCVTPRATHPLKTSRYASREHLIESVSPCQIQANSKDMSFLSSVWQQLQDGPLRCLGGREGLYVCPLFFSHILFFCPIFLSFLHSFYLCPSVISTLPLLPSPSPLLPVVPLFLFILSSRVPSPLIYKYKCWHIWRIASRYLCPRKGQLRARCWVET